VSYYAGCFAESAVTEDEAELRAKALRAEKTRRMLAGDATPTLSPDEADAVIAAAETDPVLIGDPYDRVLAAARRLDPQGSRRLTVLEIREAAGVGAMAVKQVRERARANGDWLAGWDGGWTDLPGRPRPQQAAPATPGDDRDRDRDRPRSCPKCYRPLVGLRDRCEVCDPEPILDVLRRERGMLTTTSKAKPAPAFATEFKPPPRKPKADPPPTSAAKPTTGPDSLRGAARRVYDTFQALAPGGCRAVRQAEVADRLNITAQAVGQQVKKLQEAGLWLEDWDATFAPRKPRAPKPIEPPTAKPAASEPEPSSHPEIPDSSTPPPDSPAARSIEAHATKHRVTADERRARERDADRATPVACEVTARKAAPEAATEPAATSGWKARAIELHEAVLAVVRVLPDDVGLTAEVLNAIDAILGERV